MSETTQYSVIILRNDEEANLPGAPTSLDPVAFSPALDLGELVFTQDTGRMFVGHEPSIGQPNFERTTFPYQNVEVLTENSANRFGQMMGEYLREEGSDSYFHASLPASASETDVTIEVEDNPPESFVLDDAESLAVEISYAAFNTAGTPVKMGVLTVMNGSAMANPLVVDSGHNNGAATLAFSVEKRGSGGDQHLALRYTYTGSGNVTLRWRTRRVLVGE